MEEVLNNINFNFDLIALTETFHNKKDFFKTVFWPGYCKYEGISASRKHEGCGFFSKETIENFSLKNANVKKANLNHIGLKQWTPEPKVFQQVKYTNVQGQDKQFLKYLKSTLNKLKKEDKKVTVVGGINI